MSAPKVSVGVITYNHAEYIAEALDSILAQERDFSMEVIVADDASTDGTRAIALGYAQRFPDVVRVLPRERNLGVAGNVADLLASPRGEYFAFCDGDDRWTSTAKLRTQIAFLDAHPEYVHSGHRVSGLRVPDGHRWAFTAPGVKDEPPLEDFFELGCFMALSSYVYRRAPGEAMPAWWREALEELGLGDWTLFVINAQRGKLRFFQDDWADYRIHPRGGWSSRTVRQKVSTYVAVMELFRRNLDARYAPAIRRRLSVHRAALAAECALEGRAAEAVTNLVLSMKEAGGPPEWRDRISALDASASAFARPFINRIPTPVKTTVKRWTRRDARGASLRGAT